MKSRKEKLQSELAVEILKKQKILLQLGWGLIANVSNGDWEKQSEKWQQTASKWRDEYATLMRTI